MLSITRGRSLATTAPAGSVGDECIPPAAQPPRATPGILTMYPGCTPRPRNRRVYEAACVAADGEHVIELDAHQITPRMRAWCGGSFLTVVEARLMCLGDIDELRTQIGEVARAHQFVLLQLNGDGATTGWLIGELDTPVYCLA